MRTLFVGRSGLRSGWRFALYVVLLFSFAKLFGWILAGPLGYREHSGWYPTDLLLDAALSFAAAVLAAIVMARIERVPFERYGLTRNRAFGAPFWQGVVLALAASTLTVIVLQALGAASMGGLAVHGAEAVKWLLVWAVTFLLLSLAEEFAYRGYSQVTLAEGMGFWPAALLLSAIFGATHYFAKPMESWLDAFNVGLFGLFWCYTVRRTGSLWFAIGFHAMSDFADIVIFAEPNTGNGGTSVIGHLMNVSFNGPAWLTGGVCGTEASVLQWPILAALCVCVHFAYPRVAQSPPARTAIAAAP